MPTSSYMLGGGQNGLSKLIQPSYMLGGGQSGLWKLLLATYTVGCVQKRLSGLLASYRLGVVKTVNANFYKPPTRLAAVKKHFPYSC